MAKIDGAKILAGVKKAATWGTAVQCGAGDRLQATITDNENVQELRPIRIGSGVENDETAIRAGIKPTLEISGDCRYGGYFALLCAQFLGYSPSPGSEITTGEGDYLHLMRYDPAYDVASSFLTVAFEDTTTTTREYPSVVVNRLSISTSEVPGILQFTAGCLANTVALSTSVNTNANLASVTLAESELVAYAPEDLFYINVSSAGALGSTSTYGTSDVLAITGFNMELSRPMEIPGEIRGTAGNNTPVKAGIGIEGTLTITLKNMADHIWFTTWSADTVLKAILEVRGSQINGGVTKGFQAGFPGLQLVQEPSHPISGQGNLPLTLTFKCVATSSNPTQMNSKYPFFQFFNTKSSAYL